MRIAIFAIGLLLTACGPTPPSRPDAAVASPEAVEPSAARPVYAAASTDIDSAANQPLGGQAPPNLNVLPPLPPGERSPDEYPKNLYHVTQQQVALFDNPNNLNMTVARQFLWDQYKLAWWAEHHEEDRMYIKAHHLLFNRVKVRFDEGYRSVPHLTGTMLMQLRSVPYEFPIPEVKDSDGTVINNGLRAYPLSRVEGDDIGTEDWFLNIIGIPPSWGPQLLHPAIWNKVWESPSRLDVIPQNWFKQFLTTLDQPVWQTVWDTLPPRSPAPKT